MRILIVKISAMGDILHALPVLDYLHQAAPGCEIDWVVEEAFADLLRGNPLIGQIQTVRLKKWKRSPFSWGTAKEVMAARASLAARRYDLVIDLQGNIKSGVITSLTHCPVRLGFEGRVAQERLNSFFTNRQVPLHADDLHITDQYLRVASAPFSLDFHDLPLQTAVVTTAEDDRWAASLVQDCRADHLFLCHMGTTWQTKFWSTEGWTMVGRRLAVAFPGSVQLFSWGNETEHQAVHQVVAAIGGGARVLERLPLRRLAALVKQVDLVVGGDTGIIHLAAAVGTATVSYYRASDGLRSGPRGARHRIIQAPMPCTRCFKTSCSKDMECRASITPDMVLTAIRQLVT